MTSRIELQTAYILHTRPYRDTSVIADVFTRQFGRLSLLGRGARGSRSRLRGVIQPFRRLSLSWSGRSELRTLTRAEEDGAPMWLTGQALVIGMYVNELLLRLMGPDDAHPAVFSRYDATLHALAMSLSTDTEPVLRRQLQERSIRVFEKELLGELGYGLVLDHDVATGEPIDPDALYHFDCLRGPSIARLGDSIDAIPVRGSSLVSLAANDLRDAPGLQDAKRLLRAALARHLGRKPLHSRKLLTTFPHRPVSADIVEADNIGADGSEPHKPMQRPGRENQA